MRAQFPVPDDFNPGLDSPLYSMAVQVDGKVIVGGAFSSLGGQTRSRIGRLNADGTLDGAFNPGANDLPFSLTVQPDGKILVSGAFTTLGGQTRNRIGRLNADGTLDPTFNPGADDQVLSLSPQADGKILACGYFQTLGGQPRAFLGRLNADGTLDNSFNLGANNWVFCLAPQADGKILIGGKFTSLGGQPRTSIGRFNADGTLDNSFSPVTDNWVNSIAVQTDGKIVVGGVFNSFGGQTHNHIARLNADGSLDGTFNLSANDVAYSLIIQTDGKILAGGAFTTLQTGIARINVDGTLDGSFNPGANSTVFSLALQADGPLLAGGAFGILGGQPRTGLGRLINTNPVAQIVKCDGTNITWLRSGAGPDVCRTAFDFSSNGLTWTNLGAGTRIPSGWQLTNVVLPPDGTLRAQGWMSGGYQNASGWLVQGYYGRPVLVAEPASRTNDAGTTARFRVVAGGSGPWNVQWFKNGLPLLNQGNAMDAANSTTLTLSQVLAADEGGYSAVLSNGFGSVTSAVAMLTVNDPFITQHPAGANLVNGTSVTFRVVAVGILPLNYQWYHDGVIVAGAVDSSLMLTGLSGADAGLYTVVVSNTHRSVTSAVARLTVKDPFITRQPTNSIRVAGETVTFSVTATGTPPLSYQWYQNGVAAPGTGPSLILPTTSGADSGPYSVVVSNTYGSATSMVATLTVLDPFISRQPMGTNLTPGESVVFQVVAAGTPSSYQWFHDGTAVPGAASSSLTISSLSAADSGLYTVVLSNAYGTVTSTPARLTVNAATLDNKFNPGADNWVFSQAELPDGKIIVGGTFVTLGGQPRNRIARLNPDGTLDDSFNPGANNWVLSLAVQGDGKMLMGGLFTTVGGQPRHRIARLNADGTLDSTFNPGASNQVSSLSVQADGKILVSGAFVSIGGQPRDHIARLNTDGTLDNTFNSSANDSVNAMAVQEDGRILLGGLFTTVAGQPRSHMARLNADGTLDNSFNPGADNDVNALAVQADGKILVGGNFSTLGGQSRSRIARLNGNGTLDSTFNPGADNVVFSLVLQADGKILAGGGFNTLGGQRQVGAGRLHADGTLDGTFNPFPNDTVHSLILQQDGRILAAGLFTIMDGQPRERIARLNNTAPAIQHLNFDGTNVNWLRSGSSPEVWRATFDYSANGLTWTNFGAGSRISGGWQKTGVPLLPSGTLRARGQVAGGYFNSSSWFLEGYYGRPALLSEPASRTNDAGTTARFRILVGGSGPWNVQWFKNGVLYVDQGNAVDAANTVTLTLNQVLGADEGGYRAVLSNSFGSVTSAVATLSVIDPIIIQHPWSTNLNVGDSVTFRVDARGTMLNYQWYHNGMQLAGAVDSSLELSSLSGIDAGLYDAVVSNSRGSVTSAAASLIVNAAILDGSFDPGAGNSVFSQAVQADGGIVVGGAFIILGGQPRSRIARLHADGTLDDTFNPGANNQVFSLAMQADGKILVGGLFTTLGGQQRNYFGRLLADGALDESFNPNPNGAVYALAVQADGKLLVGGLFTALGGQTRDRIGRYNADGTLDNTFNPGANNQITCMALQANGGIMLGGLFTSLGGQLRNRIGRINSDGTVDTSFHPGTDNDVSVLAEQSDGRILVGGNFTILATQPRNRIARFNANGTLDNTFNPGADNQVFSMALQADGRILIGGTFNTLGGQPRTGFGRLHADGTLDTTFNPEPNGAVYSVAVQADGRILAGGSFGIMNKQPRNKIARLNNTGPATQNLDYDGTSIIWMRSGTSPEVSQTTFEYSADETVWTLLGIGERIPGGWQLPGIFLPANGTVRAQGHSAGGRYNASGGMVETTLRAPWSIHLHAVRNGSTILLNWSGGRPPYQLQQSTDLSQPNSWQDIGVPVLNNSISLPVGPGTLFLRVRGS